MMFFCKNIYRCKVLERYKIDIEKTNQQYLEKHSVNQKYIAREYCELLAESDDYRFYGYLTYSDHSGGYILRQDKRKPKKVVYFGKSKTFNRIFHGYLFQVGAFATSGFGTSEKQMITARNIFTGEQIQFKWISDKFLWNKMYNGHTNSQDTVNDVRVVGDKLIFEVTRQKTGEMTNDKYDRDTDYRLEVEYDGFKFRATAIFPPIK